MRPQVKVVDTVISKNENHQVCTVICGHTCKTNSGVFIVANNEVPSVGDDAVLRGMDYVKVSRVNENTVYFIAMDGYEYSCSEFQSRKVLAYPEQIPIEILNKSLESSVSVELLCDWHHYNKRLNKYSYHVRIECGNVVVNKILNEG